MRKCLGISLHRAGRLISTSLVSKAPRGAFFVTPRIYFLKNDCTKFFSPISFWLNQKNQARKK